MQSIPGVPKIKYGYNPATWMLEVSSAAVEAQLGTDFAETFSNSSLHRYSHKLTFPVRSSFEVVSVLVELISLFCSTNCRKNEDLNKKLSTPSSESHDLYFPTKYSQPFLVQFKACFWKQHWSYWRNPPYNVIRFFMTTVIGLIFGVIFWDKGEKM